MLKYLCGFHSDIRVTAEFYAQNPRFEKFRASFASLRLRGESLKKMYEVFVSMDVDASGDISVKEFFRYLGIKRTSFAKRTFCLFDYDDSGELDFREFVVSLWNYCTSDSYALMSFAFDLYDLDGSGMISKEEMAMVCKEVYGDEIDNSSRAQNIIKKLQRSNNRAGGEDVEDAEPECDKFGFVNFCKRHPALLFPAFMLQQRLREEILGRAFWKRLAKNREREFGKEEIDINWLRARVTRNAFVEIAETIGYGEERVRNKVIGQESRVRAQSVEMRTKIVKKEFERRKRTTKRNLKKRRREQFGNNRTRSSTNAVPVKSQVSRRRVKSAWASETKSYGSTSDAGTSDVVAFSVAR